MHGEGQLDADKESDEPALPQICSLSTKSPKQELCLVYTVYTAGKTQEGRVKHRKGTSRKRLQSEKMPAVVCAKPREEELRVTNTRRQGQASTSCGTR